MARRGAFIVLEGLDRSGKSTQCRLLGEKLREAGNKCTELRFPDRTTVIGRQIASFLESKTELNDQCIHLLFSANRWEKIQEIKSLLLSGTHVLVDRYSYSGVAYSASKESLSIDWCKNPEIGLIKPDLVLYIDVPVEITMQRGGYGAERYEKREFQTKVKSSYDELFEKDYWRIVDGEKDVSTVHDEALKVANETIDNLNRSNDTWLKQLWNYNKEFV